MIDSTLVGDQIKLSVIADENPADFSIVQRNSLSEGTWQPIRHYGRGGQSSIRGSMHSGRFNPTQAGFTDQTGTVCRILTATDGSALIVAPRPCVLFNGDGHFDFSEWENLASDNYNEQGGGNKDADTIDESDLPEKQAAEITSEYDYYCTYEDKLGVDSIDIPTIRHYYEYRYIRDPGHCIQQHKLGPLFDPAAGQITDMSVMHPQGTHPATPDEIGIMIYSMSVRFDRALWAATYIGTVNGETVEDLRVQPRAQNGVTLRQFHRNPTLAARAPNYNLPNNPKIVAPLFILADSPDINAEGALGLYYPNSPINENCTIGVDRESGEIIYEEDRRTHTELRDTPSRIATMSWNGFRGHTLGLINPTRLPPNTYEAFRGEFYLLYGTPREIVENALRIQSF